MEKHKYEIYYDIVFDIGDNIIEHQSGVMIADHEVTEQELREYKWRSKGKIISINFTSKEVE